MFIRIQTSYYEHYINEASIVRVTVGTTSVELLLSNGEKFDLTKDTWKRLKKELKIDSL